MQQTVVAFCGLPGSGKSTLAQALQAHTGWPRLDRDALRTDMFSSGGYFPEDKRQLADAMLDRLRTSLLLGECVILDGMTFSRQAERETFSQLVLSRGAAWLLAWIDCDIEIAKARIRSDTAHPAADRNPALVDAVAARFETPEDSLQIDAALTVSEQLHALLAEINRLSREART